MDYLTRSANARVRGDRLLARGMDLRQRSVELIARSLSLRHDYRIHDTSPKIEPYLQYGAWAKPLLS